MPSPERKPNAIRPQSSDYKSPDRRPDSMKNGDGLRDSYSNPNMQQMQDPAMEPSRAVTANIGSNPRKSIDLPKQSAEPQEG